MNRGWVIESYEDANGSRPVEDFIEALPPKLRAKTLRVLGLLAEFGTDLPMPHSRPVTGFEFRELRVQFASDISRIFYVARVGRRMILLHGFVKKTQKTPRVELETAQRRLERLRQREGGANR